MAPLAVVQDRTKVNAIQTSGFLVVLGWLVLVAKTEASKGVLKVLVTNGSPSQNLTWGVDLGDAFLVRKKVEFHSTVNHQVINHNTGHLPEWCGVETTTDSLPQGPVVSLSWIGMG